MWSSCTTRFFVPALRDALAPLPPPTNLRGLRMLHSQAREYGQTPAAILGISDPLVAFVFNRGVQWAGALQPEKPKPII